MTGAGNREAPIQRYLHWLQVRGRRLWPGLLCCAAIAAVATVAGAFVPTIGSVIVAIVIGVLLRVRWRPSARLQPGISYATKFVLQCAVVLLGAQLSIASVVRLGAASLPVLVCSLTACLVGAALIGRAMHVNRELRVLIGVGTGICGASAIAAVSPTIRAQNASISYAISTVFLFNLFAVLLFPWLGRLLGMTPTAFGVFAGTAVNDTSSVVAAASVFSASSLGAAVVVKLVRTLMIIPITVALSVAEGRRSRAISGYSSRRLYRLVPWFLPGFVLVAALASLGVFNTQLVDALTQLSMLLVTCAMAGIGLSTDLRAIRATGWRPLLLGGVLSAIVAATTLATMALTGAIG